MPESNVRVCWMCKEVVNRSCYQHACPIYVDATTRELKVSQKPNLMETMEVPWLNPVPSEHGTVEKTHRVNIGETLPKLNRNKQNQLNHYLNTINKIVENNPGILDKVNVEKLSETLKISGDAKVVDLPKWIPGPEVKELLDWMDDLTLEDLRTIKKMWTAYKTQS
jgi:hypothetical protein